MASQYDAIGANYDVVKRIFFNRVEQHNLRRIILPLLEKPDISVLDLASGTGFYTKHFLEWGAASVVGVELSPPMVEVARQRLDATPNAEKATFHVANGFDVKKYFPQGSKGFDIATGIWFLNYAKDEEELTRAFQNIATNLKDDGVLVALCPHAVEDMESFASISNSRWDLPTGIKFNYLYPLPDETGYRMELTITPPANEPDASVVKFQNYHLRKSIYERAARAGGMKGKLEWNMCEFLESEWTREMKVSPNDPLWKSLTQWPDMTVLVIHKS